MSEMNHKNKKKTKNVLLKIDEQRRGRVKRREEVYVIELKYMTAPIYE